MDESAVGTQFDFGETNNVATGIRTINLEHPIIYVHKNKIIERHGLCLRVALSPCGFTALTSLWRLRLQILQRASGRR